MHRISPIIVFLAISICAASGRAGDLGAHIKGLTHEPSLVGARWGICIYSLRDDSLILSYNDEKLFVPGSTIKLFTSTAALDSLGADWRFETELIAQGALDSSGTLWGDLVVWGSGDPTLCEADTTDTIPRGFLQIAGSLRHHGLRQVRGRLVGDARAWQREPPCPSWEVGDFAEEWMPVPGALSLGHSDLTPDSARFGVLETMPDSAVPLGASPTSAFLSVFSKALRRAGIAIHGDQFNEGSLSDSTRLFVHRSAPLSEIIKRMNKESDNFCAEQLCRTLGGGSGSRGVLATGKFLAEAGVDTSQLRLADGSGLSRKNLVSPRAVVRLLRYMHRHSLSHEFMQSLAVMGVDGTLAERSLKGAHAEVRAKTGTLEYASALSGYVITESGEDIAFSLLCNDFLTPVETIRDVQDSICSLIATSVGAPNSGRVTNPARRGVIEDQGERRE